MLKEITFTIDARPNLQMKFCNLTATQVLSFNTTVNYDTFEQSEKAFNFVFEHTMVNLNNQWIYLKEPSHDVYFPVDIENDLNSLQQIFITFINLVIKPLFTQSKESSQ